MSRFKECEVSSVEQVCSFDDEYVYDLEMNQDEGYDPWFFANNILVHNSSYFSMQKLLSHSNTLLADQDGNVHEKAYDIIQEAEDALNKGVDRWARVALNSKDPRFFFKREAIAERGVFLNVKKRYILKILDDEGAKGVKYKYTGLSVVKTTMPKSLKPMVKNLFETMVETRDSNECQKIYNQIYEKFMKMDYNELAMVSGLSDYEKFGNGSSGFNTVKGATANFKAAYFHNQVLKDLGLQNKYPRVGSGDKVKYVYIKKNNKYGISIIGWQGDMPKEFNEFIDLDYKLMFEKTIISAIKSVYEAIEWKLFKPGTAPEIDLDSFFSQ